MDCKRFQELLDEYLDDTLEAAETEEFTAHMGKCAACSALFLNHEKTMELLGQSGVSSPDFVSGAMDKIRLIQAEEKKKRRRKILRYASSAAAVVVIAAVSGALIMSGGLGGSTAMDSAAPEAFPEDDLIAESVECEPDMEAEFDEFEAPYDNSAADISSGAAADMSEGVMEEEADEIIMHVYCIGQDDFNRIEKEVIDDPSLSSHALFNTDEQSITINIEDSNIAAVYALLESCGIEQELFVDESILITCE